MHRAQFKAIEIIRNSFDSVRIILQGEEVLLQRYFQARQWKAEFPARFEEVPETRLMSLERKQLDLNQMRAEIHAMFDKYASPAFIDWFMRHTFFSWDLGEYLDEYVSKGLMIGCRLHSNLLALANEVPTFYLTYDQRIQELVNLFAIPGCRVTEFNEGIDLLHQDWRPFEQKYRHYYGEMLRFLEINKLAHRMAPIAAPDEHASGQARGRAEAVTVPLT